MSGRERGSPRRARCGRIGLGGDGEARTQTPGGARVFGGVAVLQQTGSFSSSLAVTGRCRAASSVYQATSTTSTPAGTARNRGRRRRLASGSGDGGERGEVRQGLGWIWGSSAERREWVKQRGRGREKVGRLRVREGEGRDWWIDEVAGLRVLERGGYGDRWW